MNHNVNYGLWGMMCQCRFTYSNKCITLVGDVDNGGGCACVGAEGVWEIPVTSSQFAMKLKLLQKKKK